MATNGIVPDLQQRLDAAEALLSRYRSCLVDTAHALRQVLPERPDGEELDVFASDFEALEDAEDLLKETDPAR